MARSYHSASSYKVGKVRDERGKSVGCLRAWYYAYVEKLRTPDVPFAAIAHYVADRSKDERNLLWWRSPESKRKAPRDLFAPWTPGDPVLSKVRSASLGTAMHDGKLTPWYNGVEDIDWFDLPGKVAASGLHLLPQPDRCEDAQSEVAIGNTPYERRSERDPHVVLVVDGIAWRGSRDLLAKAPKDFVRLGIKAPHGWALLDYKSSRNIEQYAPTSDELLVDFAANLYGFSTCLDLDVSHVPGRWVYFETGDTRRAAAVDFRLTIDTAGRRVEEATRDVREWDTIRDETDAPCNTDACEAYGGCLYHKSAGGPCDARRSVGQLIQARVLKRRPDMPLPNSDKFKNLANGDTTPPESGEQENTDAPAKPKGALKKSAAKKAKPEPEPEAPAADTAAAEDFKRSFVIPGEHGAVTITVGGHPHDVADTIIRIAF